MANSRVGGQIAFVVDARGQAANDSMVRPFAGLLAERQTVATWVVGLAEGRLCHRECRRIEPSV